MNGINIKKQTHNIYVYKISAEIYEPKMYQKGSWCHKLMLFTDCFPMNTIVSSHINSQGRQWDTVKQSWFTDWPLTLSVNMSSCFTFIKYGYSPFLNNLCLIHLHLQGKETLRRYCKNRASFLKSGMVIQIL